MTGGCETLLPVYFENLSNVKVYIHRACYRYVKQAQRAWEVRRKDRQLASTDQCLGRLKIRISFKKK